MIMDLFLNTLICGFRPRRDLYNISPFSMYTRIQKSASIEKLVSSALLPTDAIVYSATRASKKLVLESIEIISMNAKG